MDVRVGLWRKLSPKELMLLNGGVGEDSWESIGLPGNHTRQSRGNQSWIFIGRTDAEAKTPILWPPDAKNLFICKDWYWERLKPGGEGDDRGSDGWMASLTQWTWVWVNSGSWWWTGRPGTLQSMGSQSLTRLNDRTEPWTSTCSCKPSCFNYVWLFVMLWTVACLDPLCMGFYKQEYWSGVLCPPPGDLQNPGIKPTSLTSSSLADVFFTTSATWEALEQAYQNIKIQNKLHSLSIVF